MRKIILVLILVVVISGQVMADDNWFDLSVGMNASFKDGAFSSLKEMKGISLKDWNFGIELRNRLLFVEADLSGELSVTETQALSYSGLLLTGFSADIFSVARLGLCVGPRINYVHDGRKGTLVIDGNLVENATFIEALNKSSFHIRATLDFFAGPVLKIGVAYTLPTAFTLSEHDFSKIIPTPENFGSGSVGIVFQMTLI